VDKQLGMMQMMMMMIEVAPESEHQIWSFHLVMVEGEELQQQME